MIYLKYKIESREQWNSKHAFCSIWNSPDEFTYIPMLMFTPTLELISTQFNRYHVINLAFKFK